MSQFHTQIEALRHVTAVAAAEVDFSGRLVDANAGFLRLVAPGESSAGTDVAASFLSPDFESLIRDSRARPGIPREGLFTMGGPAGKGRVFRGSATPTERGLFFLLEHDLEAIWWKADAAQVLDEVGIWTWYPDTGKVVGSDEFHRIFGLGLEPAEIPLGRILELVHPDDREAFRASLEGALGAGEAREIRYRVINPGGEVRVVRSRVRAIQDGGGRPVRLTATALDVTEQTRLEEALSEELTRRRILLEGSRDGIVVLDENGAVFEANRRFGEMLGYSAEETMALHVWDWDAQWDREELLRMVRGVEGDGSIFETLHRRKSGDVLHVEISTNGAVCGGRWLVFCVCRDISERKRAEQERMRREALYRAVIETSTDGFWAADEEGRIREVNDAIACRSGYSREELLGMHISDLEVAESSEETRAHIARIRASGADLFESSLRARDGTTWPVEVSVAYWPGADGRVLAFLRDITGRKRAEQAIRDGRAKLEAALASMTDAVFISDAKGNYVEFNDAFATFHRFRDKEECVRTLSEYPAILEVSTLDGTPVPPESRAVARALRGETAVNAEYALRRKDSGDSWIGSFSYGPVRDRDGAIAGAVVAARDITEQKRAEVLLRQQLDLQGQLAKIAEAVPGAIYTFHMREDGTSHLTYASSAFEEMAGLPWEELAEDLGRGFERIHPEDVPGLMGSIETAVRSQAAWHGEFRYRHPTRGERWIEGWAAPRQESDGRVLFHGYLADVTDRKRVEEALRASEATLKAVVTGAIDAIITIDTRGTVLSFNPAAERVFGYAAGEVVGHNVCMLMPSPLREEHDSYLAHYFRTGERRVIGIGREIPARRKDGSVFPMEIGVSEIRMDGQDFFVGILRDVTERRAAEEEIRALNASLESEVSRRTAELESMLANATIGLAFADRDLRCIRVNPFLAGINGLPVADHLGRTIREINPVAAPLIEPSIREVFRTGRPIHGGELRLPPRDGASGVRVCVLGFYPVLNTEGAVISVGTTLTDITERKRAEEEMAGLNLALRAEIAEREEIEQRMRRLSAVIEACPDFIAMADSEGRLFYINRAFRETIGRLPDCEPLRIADCHPESALGIIEEEGLPTALRTGSWVGETAVIIQAGRSIPVSQLIIAQPDLQGDRPFFATIMRDISERRQMEEALRVRSGELLAANAELGRAARLKDEFLASMSHELRTPLNGILGITQGLQERVYGELNPEQAHCLEDIEECGLHLLALINDILDVAKIEAGKVELEPDRIRIEDLCQGSLRLVRDVAQKRRIRVSLRLEQGVDVVTGDPRRLKQVLVNLLSNAVKFTPEGGQVGLAVAGEPEAGRVRFTIWDTGIGIASRDLERLFQPFVQLDSSLSRQYAGTGLGLALVKRLVGLHGGDVEVESRPGEGSRFSFLLPWQPDAEPSPDGGPPGQGRGQGGPAILQNNGGVRPTILLVEDNPLSARGLADYLRFKGYRVEWAEDAASGIDQAERIVPSLILMDIQMPGMDGMEAIRRIRKVPGLDSVPIIALTALAMPGDRERILAGGATAYVSKPAPLDELRRVIESLLVRPALAVGCGGPAGDRDAPSAR